MGGIGVIQFQGQHQLAIKDKGAGEWTGYHAAQHHRWFGRVQKILFLPFLEELPQSASSGWTPHHTVMLPHKAVCRILIVG